MINCHVHLFTANHVPSNLVPLRLAWFLRNPMIAKATYWFLKNAWPFQADAMTRRISIFSKHFSMPSQEDALNQLLKHYPHGTNFVVLPMDFEFCGRKPPKISTDDQLYELIGLSSRVKQIFPFVPIDPRRPNLLSWAKRWLDLGGVGFKVYPSLGFHPSDERLFPLFDYASSAKIPVISHCGGTSTKGAKVTTQDALNFIRPLGWVPILNKFPDLKLCLSHFGGGKAWDSALQLYGDSSTSSWVKDILGLISSYPNVYTDISYTSFENHKYLAYLKLLLQDKVLQSRLLFGTDYYMVDFEGSSEKMMCILLRDSLGEDIWRQISHDNPRAWLLSSN